MLEEKLNLVFGSGMQTTQQNSQVDRSLISLEEARKIIGEISPLAPEPVHINDGVGRITATDTVAISNCTSTDASLKDGFAVVSADITEASRQHPKTLQVVGTLTAGQDTKGLAVSSGKTVRIMTGAPVPHGADAVLTSEFAELDGDRATIFRDAHPGRNILEHGHDVR